jgi:adenylyltransferase/sulfurtransferase
MENNASYERYQRQIILKGFGEPAQQKLLQASVLVIGAGGLGCPALQYLAAACVGTIGIADEDVVSLSNLHRQVLYATSDIGLSKVARAAFYLRQLNPGIKIVTHPVKITSQNAWDIITAYDVIIDGTDNFAARYVINDACVLLNKPFVYGAVSQYEGQVAVFNHKGNTGEAAVNYRDLFPKPPTEDEVPNCATAGVMGVLPGIIGTMQAAEAIKLLTGIGQPLSNRLLTYNVLNSQVYELALVARNETNALIPADKTVFMNTDYEWLCNASNDNAFEIDVAVFDSLLTNNIATIIDVREKGELPAVDEFSHVVIPLSQLKDNVPAIANDTIIVFCQSGKRSLQAARLLSGKYGTSKTIHSLRGGIVAWKQYQQQPS